MFNEKKYIEINGKEFEKELFDELLTIFKEGFSHSSSSIEDAFSELDKIEKEIDDKKKEDKAEEAFQLFNSLDEKAKNDILNLTKLMLVRLGYNYKVFWDEMPRDQEGVDKLYEQYFTYFNEDIPYFIRFNEDGSLNDKETFGSIFYLFNKLPDKKAAMEKAYNMQKDNLDAFDYAMELKEISINDIIEINKKVIYSDVDKVEGFKRTNNAIFGAGFQTTDKKDVYPKMNELLYEYSNNFEIEILNPYEPGILPEEKTDRLQKIFKKEAIFHIRFERIHPFNDGNGRTGRIILNHNLLRQGIAPVLITNVMASDYKKYINTNDVEGLAKLLLNSSSQLVTSWVSTKKVHKTEDKECVNNDMLAEVLGYDDDNFGFGRAKKRK